MKIKQLTSFEQVTCNVKLAVSVKDEVNFFSERTV